MIYDTLAYDDILYNSIDEEKDAKHHREFIYLMRLEEENSRLKRRLYDMDCDINILRDKFKNK